MPYIVNILRRSLNIRPGETSAIVTGFLMQFSLFVCYFAMRPIRETMGITGGISNLPWLFTATFIATLVVSPLFGWIASKAQRSHISRWVYSFFVLNILMFAAAIQFFGETALIARIFFVWLSVFNLIAVSLTWSVLADVFTSDQAKRLFASMAAGASLGGLVGPLIGVMFVTVIGNGGLLLISALMLVVTICCAEHLQKRPRSTPVGMSATYQEKNAALGGNPFDGAIHVFSTPLLFGIALFVILLASVSTFLYFEQARFVADRFTDRAEQTQFFSGVDAVVQCLTLVIQFFLTGRIAAAFGIRALLLTVPLVMVGGFIMLSVSAMLGIFVVVMVIRRVGEYALVRPGREMLFTAVDTSDKYKAKNFIDSVVYRGADALSGWLKTASDFLLSPQMGGMAGAILAIAWSFSAIWVLRLHQRVESAPA